MTPVEYWEEALACTMEENGVTATAEQITAMAEDLKISHEHYGMAFYQPPMSELPVFRELEEAKAALKAEREKVTCKECGGTGSITTPGPYHYGISQCWQCGGEGRHSY